MKRFSFRTAGNILFGAGIIDQVGLQAKALGAGRVFLVVDPALVKAGLSEKIAAPLKKEGIDYIVFDKIEPEPYVETANKAAYLARAADCNVVVGVGGGSAMDVAKAVSILLTNEGGVADYQGIDKVRKPGVPKIIAPTTAGTGSEVTLTAVFSKSEPRSKGGINSPYLYPEVALLDPELTVTLPPEVTASTGMDALTHAIEAFTSLISSEITDVLALRAIELISAKLDIACKDGGNLEARSDMLLGSLFAGMALGNAGVTATHALAYPFGGLFRIAHGVANGLLLPYVMTYNLNYSLDKFVRVAEAMGEDVNNLPLEMAARKAVEAVERLAGEINLVRFIKELKIPEKAIPQMAESAMKVTKPIENNPRKVTKEDCAAIYKMAWG